MNIESGSIIISEARLQELLSNAIEEGIRRARKEVPNLLNAKELQTRLGISERTMFNYIKAGMLQCVKFGNKMYFSADQVESDIKKNKFAI